MRTVERRTDLGADVLNAQSVVVHVPVGHKLDQRQAALGSLGFRLRNPGDRVPSGEVRLGIARVGLAVAAGAVESV